MTTLTSSQQKIDIILSLIEQNDIDALRLVVTPDTFAFTYSGEVDVADREVVRSVIMQCVKFDRVECLKLIEHQSQLTGLAVNEWRMALRHTSSDEMIHFVASHLSNAPAWWIKDAATHCNPEQVKILMQYIPSTYDHRRAGLMGALTGGNIDMVQLFAPMATEADKFHALNISVSQQHTYLIDFFYHVERAEHVLRLLKGDQHNPSLTYLKKKVEADRTQKMLQTEITSTTAHKSRSKI